MSSVVRVDELRATGWRHLPALALGAVILASLANQQLQVTRSLALALVALATMALLPREALPRPRAGLQLVTLALLVVFALGLLRILAFRSFDIASIGIVSSVVGMCACWFLGMAAAVYARDRFRLLVAFAGWIPLAGAAVLLAAFARGAHPETNYWQFVDSVTGQGGERVPFALSEDVLGLLVFFVGVTPFSLSLRSAWARLALLGGVGGTFALLILNGQLTYIVAALCAAGGAAVLGRPSMPAAHRRRALVPLVVALVASAGGAGITLWSKPEFAAPIVTSLSNKNVLAGNDLFDGRDEFWRGSIPHLADSPLVGYPLDEITTPETRYAYNNPHNDYLLFALKFGVPAALLLLAAIARVTWQLVVAIRRPESETGRAAALVGFAAWCALWLPPMYKGALSSPYYANLALAGIAGLCLTIVRLHADPARRLPLPPE